MNNLEIRVLLIEDDEDDYIITRDMLCEAQGNFDLNWVKSYDEALEAMEGNDADVCLVDYRLGDHDGLELLHEAKERGFKVPIILLSGQGDYSVDMSAMKAGAVGYLIKGQIDGPLLERSIRYGIESKQLKVALAQQAHELATSKTDLEQFAYTACQDLQAPLQGIASHAQLLSKRYQGKLDAAGEAFLAHTSVGVASLQDFLSSLQAYSQANR
jgi:DNA-binding NtrC family response regulator